MNCPYGGWIHATWRNDMARVLITVPTWNEEVVIGANLAVLRDAISRLLPDHDVLIEVTDNGSTDRTRTIVRQVMEYGASNMLHGNGPSVEIRLAELSGKGKGIAIRTSWDAHFGDADILAFMDADLAADLAALPTLISRIADGSAELVCGSRYVAGSRIERGFVRDFVSKVYRVLQQVVLHLPVQDAQCGFKAISSRTAAEILPLCREDAWMFDTELIAIAARHSKCIAEIPVAWIEHRDPRRRSALRLFRHGWGFLSGLWRIRRRTR
jgi:glycosyltransferase involved in cell wall biosynthesis